MTRANEENGLTSTARGGLWRVVIVVAICVILLGAIAAWAVPIARLRIDRARADESAIGRVDQQGTQVAALAPAQASRPTSPPRLVSDSDLISGDLRDALLAAGVAERVTAEQVASRQKGCLRPEALSAPQRAAVVRIAQRRGMLNEQEQPTESGTSLRIGLGQTWELWVSMPGNGKVRWFKLGTLPRPPTVAAIANAPLAASRLRTSWPHPAPSLGIKRALRLLKEAAKQESEPDSVGWRLRDLPLLYRNWIEDEWQRPVRAKSGGERPSLDPNSTNVLWTKAILVSVDLQLEDGSGGGTEILVPTF